MKKRYWLIPLIVTGVVIIAVAAVPLAALLQIKSNPKELKKSFTLRELEEIKENSYMPLNKVNYPDTKLKNITIDEDYKDSILDFTYLFTSNLESFSYSPLNLYFAYDTLSWGSDDTALTNKWNNVLGLTREKRDEGLKKLYPADYYLNDYGTLQLYQGLFLNSNYSANNEFISKMTERYCEAYSVDFSSNDGTSKMLNWIDEKLDEKNFITMNDLQIDDETMAYQFNTLYFRSKWSTKYMKNNTKNEFFYQKDGESYKVPFMTHTVTTNVYEYDNYYSFYDYYKNGESVQYLIAKDDNRDISSLVKGTNFYKETKEAKQSIVEISMPKFTDEVMVDFLPTLKNVGLGDVTAPNVPALNNMFSSLDEGQNVYLALSKQKNKVTFDEDGTIVKSLGMQAYGSKATAPLDYYSFQLNHPFICTIYDRNGLPIYTSKINKI